MSQHIARLVASRPFADIRPLREAFGALSLCVTFVGVLFLPGLF